MSKTPILRTAIVIGAGVYSAATVDAIRETAQAAADRICARAEGDWHGAKAAPVTLRREAGRSMHHIAISCAWPVSLGGSDASAEATIEDALVVSGVLSRA